MLSVAIGVAVVAVAENVTLATEEVLRAVAASPLSKSKAWIWKASRAEPLRPSGGV
jgi:hypothetical protein